ncbi:MAG: CDP-diacylglycerol--serine O-phosphatidyltransferase [Nitrospinae bacterium]|nr:CDP-diacylglycerol--serine O-phosphatidyltransferase [Nitrospinota bacterium]
MEPESGGASSQPPAGNGGEGRLAPFGAIRKGIFIVPSLITSASFFCGFYSIIASINGDYYAAAWVIFLAIVFDGLDGRIARATGSTTEFGVEYDSLSDLISFGAAPAILMYNWVLQPFGRIGWMAAFLFVICGALRLARFNTQTSEVRKDRFVGLPIPAGAGLLAAIVLLTRGALELDKAPATLVVITVYITAFLMVSSIPYRNFKQVDLARRKPFQTLVAVMFVVFVVAQLPHHMLFLMGLAFALHGPVEWYLERRDMPWSKNLLNLVGMDKD